MAEALYRKYRPQIFEDVVGQEPIERTLKNAIAQDKVSHAYLFCGPRGTGKTTTARLLAKALLCQHGPTPDPDGTCEDCLLVADGTHPDVYELDAASRTGVENVREEIISRVHFAPTRGRSKVYIIDEVHMLSTAAFNALLKTLEEPPSHVVFILCTTDPQKVPETIHSRCQRFDFHRISPESMVARLGAVCMAEDVEFEGEALDLIAQRADGGLRDALTSLEQIIAFENGKVTLAGAERLLGSIDSNDLAEIMSYIGRRDIANCFKWIAAYVETGADLAQFARDMAERVRNLYVMAVVGEDADVDVPEITRHELATELSWFGPDRCARLMGVVGDLMAELKTTTNPRLAFEIALTRMVRPDSDLTLEGLAERVEALESGYSAVAHVLPGPAAATPASRDSWFDPSVPEEGLPAAAPSPAGPVGESRERSEEVRREPAPARAGNADNAAAQPVAPAANDARPQRAASPDAGASSADGAASAGKTSASTLANPAALQRIWQASLADVKRHKQAYGVLFMNTKATFDEVANRLDVVFPAEATFAFNAVQKPDVQDVLAQALAKTVGTPVAFAFQRAGEQAAAVYEVPQQASQPMPAEPAEPVAPTEPAAPAEPAEPVASPEPAAPAEPAEPAAQPQDMPAYDEVPYDEVPYDEVPYESVPYDDDSFGQADAGTNASPASDNQGPTGALEEDPADLQAMLQASFGSGVVLSETDE